jgi:hypothetical protein
MVKLVHPHILVCSLAFGYAKDLTLVKADHEQTKQHYTQKHAYSDFWNFGYFMRNILDD